jgi:hypothetical protein
MTFDLLSLFSNPWVTHILMMIAGWLGIAQPAIIANLWAKILWGASTVAKAQDLIKMIDAMLKVNGVIPADAPTPAVADVKAVVDNKTTVTEVKAKLKAMKK